MNLNTEALATVDTSVVAFQEIEQIIQETLNSLPPQCRKVFELSRFREMKNKEIAEELNISVRTVGRTYLKRNKNIQNCPEGLSAFSCLPVCTLKITILYRNNNA